MKKKNRLFQILIPDTRIYMIIITVLIVLIAFYNRPIGIVGIFLLAYLLMYNLRVSNMKKKEWTDYIERLSTDIDSATKQSILNMPIPLSMVEIDGTVTWYNQKFTGILQEKDLLEKNIHDLVNNFDLHELMRKDTPEIGHARIDNRSYKVLFNVVRQQGIQGSDYLVVLYWIENTAFENLKKKYNQEKMVVALVQVDNYDEVMKSTEDVNRAKVSADIDHRTHVWAAKLKGLTRKYEQDKYIVIFEYQYLENQEVKRFEILDEVREIQLGNQIPPTLSIGVGTMGKDFQECMAYANTAKDLCLGRGGDQVAVKKNDDIKFYGGKSKAVEKRTKVKARVIAYGLRQLMEQSEIVLVMGHKNADLDALGAALGIYRAAKNRKKEAYIVLNESNPSIEVLYQRMMKIPAYQKAVISCQEAQKLQLAKKTLVVVVDTHRPVYTECPELLKEDTKIVLIDHHRRSTDFIENPILTYHETYASSTCEMVTEIIHYMEEKLHLESLEAEALMAGIALDTKNFTFKTGVRTFEAASYLRRAGADTTLVRQMFQDGLDSIVSRAEVVKKTELILEKIAIAVSDDESENANLVAAQAADIMLNIRGVKASFVLGNDPKGFVFISGRSLGDINVQVILERLGGGGHMTVAGAQLKDVSMEEARNTLIQSIEQVLEEEQEEEES